MVDEKDSDNNSDNDSDKEPGPLRRYGPLAAVVLLTQVAIAALFVYMFQPAEPEPLLPTRSTLPPNAEAAEDRRLPFYYSPEGLHRILVNPAGTNARRYLVANVELGLKAYDRSKKPPKDNVTGAFRKDAAALELLGRYTSKMRAIIADVLAQRSVDEFDRRDLLPMQDEIRDRINREVLRVVFPASKPGREVTVVEVMFTELVIQ